MNNPAVGDVRCPALHPAGPRSTLTTRSPPAGAAPPRSPRRTPASVRVGRQYRRPIVISFIGRDFDASGPGEIIAWSSMLDDEEALCIVNAHGTDARGADVLVDASLNPPGSSMAVIANTALATAPGEYRGSHPVGSSVPVHRRADGKVYVEDRDASASEVLVLTNHP